MRYKTLKKQRTLRQYLKEQLKNPEFKKAYEKEDFTARVALEIAENREKYHLTQKELAKRMHTTQQAISRIEKGDQNITIAMIEKISEALGKKPELKLV